MGMTIAEPIQTLEYLRNSGVFPFSTKEGVLYTAESIDVVISTMHKYQKIEQLIADYEEYKWGRIDVKDIREIIDGNVD